ncbi:MAG TPA: hypothetical protein VGD63_17050 [Steroidobacteraceae bacterium]
MGTRRELSTLERMVAICLSLVWIGGGSIVLAAALLRSWWVEAACAALGIAYGVAWARAAMLSRLLT